MICLPDVMSADVGPEEVVGDSTDGEDVAKSLVVISVAVSVRVVLDVSVSV